jgi:Domain of unknown function (DUF4253)
MEQLATVIQRAGVDSPSLVRAYKIGRHQVYRMTVPGTEAVATWKRLRKLVPKMGHWPLLLGTDEDLDDLAYSLERAKGQTPTRVLRKAEKIDAVAEFTRWQQVVERNCREAAKEWEESGAPDVQQEYEHVLAQAPPFQGLPRGDWPEDAEPAMVFRIPFDVLTKKPLPAVHVGLVPTTQGWTTPAFLTFGGWKDCPRPHDHLAVLRYWGERYGAEVVGITHDIVEMLVARPPRSRRRALELAREQYLYCSDIVDQGTRTIDNLAAILLGGKVWYFWWD